MQHAIIVPNISYFQIIQWAFYVLDVLSAEMGIQHGCFGTVVPQDLLQILDVYAPLR